MRRTIRTTGDRRRRGSALLEASLALGVFLYLAIGVLDIGQVLVMHQGLVERVRVGARYGSVNPYDTAKIKNVVLYNTDTPGVNAKPLLNLDPSWINVQLYDSTSSAARIEVSIRNHRFQFFSPLIAGRRLARPIVCTMPLEELSGSTY